MFLHARSEEPQVRDLGFAISPGQHALVGIQRNDVSTVNTIPNTLSLGLLDFWGRSVIENGGM